MNRTSWGPALAKLFAAAKPGVCFCGRPINRRCRGPQLMCTRDECRRAYQAAYRADHPRGSSLRLVVAREPHPFRARRVLILLDCGHRLDVPKSHADFDHERRHCPTCRTYGVAVVESVRNP